MRIKAIAAGIFLLTLSCKTNNRIESTKQTAYIFSDTSINTVDSSVYEFIKPYKENMEGEMNKVIAESEIALERGLPEGRLGNFVADACMSEMKRMGFSADFIFLNNGGLRRALPAGKITKGDVYELMPFENTLVILTLDGKLVRNIFNFIASKGGAPVSGVQFKISNKEAIEILLNGQPLDTMKNYRAITSDYLANGGDSYGFLSNAQRETTGLKVRDAIMQNLETAGLAGKKISVNIEGRITNAH
jgi:2',3'-cyclic-nucleotide 2'-phosphodiesterase (5'-nucleotidase family)